MHLSILVSVNSNLHNILPKSLADFPHSHSWNNGQQWQRNKSCCNDYHRFFEGKGLRSGSNQQPLISSPVYYPLSYNYSAKIINWNNNMKKIRAWGYQHLPSDAWFSVKIKKGCNFIKKYFDFYLLLFPFWLCTTCPNLKNHLQA